MICHPKLVETGLDLLDFPTIIFYESGYSLHTLRQASRRSWRIGQRRPVRVKFRCYEGTMRWLGAASALVGRHIPAVFVLGLRSQTWHGTSIVSRNWTSVLVAGSPTIADQLEVARIVDTLVSIPGHLAVRYSLWIFGLLRPCGLPGLFFLITAAWIVRFRGPAMRGCVDVDLRYPRLPSGRSFGR